MPISGDLYKQIGRSAAGPVSVIAAYDRNTGALVGLTASSFVTLSFDPPMVMFALQQNADSYASIVSSKAFGVSLLTADQSEIASRFARKGREKAEKTTFEHGHILNVPLIPEALAQIECLTTQIMLSGDHAIVVGLVEGALMRAGKPLLYFGGQYGCFEGLPADASRPVQGTPKLEAQAFCAKQLGT
jgi:flavin reductase (DIM6/NTAB) family NADH-FMN oxidoreductase RutF